MKFEQKYSPRATLPLFPAVCFCVVFTGLLIQQSQNHSAQNAKSLWLQIYTTKEHKAPPTGMWAVGTFFLCMKGGAAIDLGKCTLLSRMQFFDKWGTDYLMAEHKLKAEIEVCWVRSHTTYKFCNCYVREGLGLLEFNFFFLKRSHVF